MPPNGQLAMIKFEKISLLKFLLILKYSPEYSLADMEIVREERKKAKLFLNFVNM